MKARLTALLTIVFALAGVCSSAQAAVNFNFTEAKHEQAQINRGDEYVTYRVKLKNVGTDPTSGVTTVNVDLPTGATLSHGIGAEWSCDLPTQSCSSSKVVVAGAEFPQLQMRAWLFPGEVPDEVNAQFTASGGGASVDATASDSFTLGPEVPFGIEGFSAAACAEPLGASTGGICFENFESDEYSVAGAHPFAATSALDLTSHTSPLGEPTPVESLRDLYFELPAGFVANPETAEICTFVKVQQAECPEASIVGGVKVILDDGFEDPPSPLYRIVPEEGYPAAFAFRPVAISGLTYVLRAKLRANGDYGVTAVSPLPPQGPRFIEVEEATLCGYGPILQPAGAGANPYFIGCKKPGDPGAREVPALTNPTKCSGAPPVTRAQIDSYQNPGTQTDEGFPELSDPRWKSAEATALQNTGCEALIEAWVAGPPTSPSFTFKPDSTRAAAPAAYTAHLHIPQEGLLKEGELATSHLKDTTVALPEGLVLNPSAADGLGVCTLEQAGYLGNNFGSPNPIRFKTTAPGCPQSSKVGLVEASTPILDETLDGAIYLAAQKANPFGSDFATYLVIDDAKTGIKATLAGEVIPSEATGQITATFKNNPQAPVEDLEVEFFEGPRASLSNPDVCGTYATQTQLTPWSVKDLDSPQASEIATSVDPVAIDTPASGQSSCPTAKEGRAFDLGFDAGSMELQAGAHSPFYLRLTRPEGDQEISGVTVSTPPGFAATLKGVPACSEQGLAQAQGRTATGDGALELSDPSCPASSQIGTTTIGAGAGPSPFYVKTGKVYLTGPYKGAPLGLAFVVPAVAGPFDLGVQVVRTALNVNPVTAQVSAVSDPIPQILKGVPLQVRDIRVDLDRPGFTLNPTNCEPMAIGAQVTGGSGATANLSNRFQVGGCEALKFKPKLKLQLHGSPKRAKYQRLVATVTARPGDANIARTAVTFPHSIFLAQEHIRTVCTRVQFAADACPKGSIYGHAEAESPLLDGKLTGPVYLRSSNNLLPDVVVALRGPDSQPIEVELAGRVDSKNKGIRNTFSLVPDAPVSKFTLEMFGGKKSLLVASRNLCKGRKQKATVRMSAHNGRQRNFRPVVQSDCGKKGKGKGKGGKKR